ncbi:STAS/SEC14 domain-containing protein [Natroniella acetigena]|uniref:STAS/SEC14 domain-containing protein n=1 Tax=Natroniella acetigena TaxID=52004 RepID=UPI00200B1D56|nr:STAS/SEC14 domain-containing protein [Natroniella acetigena]MCK8828335.1 STAS/SEC14 domain-containing protein [Natroniella acetigena]
MHNLHSENNLIVIKGGEIINGGEAKDICNKVEELLQRRENKQRLLLDLRKVDLEESQFDVFIQYLTEIEVEKIALVLDKLITKFKFKLWSRRYRDYVQLEQFDNLEEAKKWLK